MTEPILRLTNVTKRFRGLVAINDVSLDLAEGSISSLIGPNGAGKSTLFNLVTGYVPPSAGEIYFQRQPDRRRADRENRGARASRAHSRSRNPSRN